MFLLHKPIPPCFDKLISYFPQKTFLYEATLIENILLDKIELKEKYIPIVRDFLEFLEIDHLITRFG